ncbi:hypothetical protein [Streptomyces virginiae]
MGARIAGGRFWANRTDAVVRLGRMGMWCAARRRDRALAEVRAVRELGRVLAKGGIAA